MQRRYVSNNCFGRFSAFSTDFVMCFIDEAPSSFKDQNQIKALVGNPERSIEFKGLEATFIDNFMGLWIGTNESQSPWRVEKSGSQNNRITMIEAKKNIWQLALNHKVRSIDDCLKDIGKLRNDFIGDAQMTQEERILDAWIYEHNYILQDIDEVTNWVGHMMLYANKDAKVQALATDTFLEEQEASGSRYEVFLEEIFSNPRFNNIQCHNLYERWRNTDRNTRITQNRLTLDAKKYIERLNLPIKYRKYRVDNQSNARSGFTIDAPPLSEKDMFDGIGGNINFDDYLDELLPSNNVPKKKVDHSTFGQDVLADLRAKALKKLKEDKK